jgi:hypothetical protein
LEAGAVSGLRIKLCRSAELPYANSAYRDFFARDEPKFEIIVALFHSVYVIPEMRMWRMEYMGAVPVYIYFFFVFAVNITAGLVLSTKVMPVHSPKQTVLRKKLWA